MAVFSSAKRAPGRVIPIFYVNHHSNHRLKPACHWKMMRVFSKIPSASSAFFSSPKHQSASTMHPLGPNSERLKPWVGGSGNMWLLHGIVKEERLILVVFDVFLDAIYKMIRHIDIAPF